MQTFNSGGKKLTQSIIILRKKKKVQAKNTKQMEREAFTTIS